MNREEVLDGVEELLRQHMTGQRGPIYDKRNKSAFFRLFAAAFNAGLIDSPTQPDYLGAEALLDSLAKRAPELREHWYWNTLYRFWSDWTYAWQQVHLFNRHPGNPEFPDTWPSGAVEWAKYHTTVLLDALGRASRAAGTAMDIAQVKDNAPAARGALRALRTVSAANRELVRATSEAEFIQAVCKGAVEKGGYLMAWVGFAEHGQDKAVRPVAQYGYEDAYLTTATITWADTERGRGPTGTAIRTGRTQVNQNILTNPAMAPWRKAALERGFKASIGLPLKGELGTFGALNIYAKELDAYFEDEIAILEGLAADLALGIVALRAKAERDRIGEPKRQHESETRLRHGVE